jgi:DNA-binding FrmR family transcriptional regulator
MQTASKQDALRRISLIEGQISGVRRMIEQERDCSDILTQIAAVRGAMDKIGLLLISDHIELLALGFTGDAGPESNRTVTRNDMLHGVRVALGRFLK